jgi:hypothetical protein
MNYLSLFKQAERMADDDDDRRKTITAGTSATTSAAAAEPITRTTSNRLRHSIETETTQQSTIKQTVAFQQFQPLPPGMPFLKPFLHAYSHGTRPAPPSTWKKDCLEDQSRCKNDKPLYEKLLQFQRREEETKEYRRAFIP